MLTKRSIFSVLSVMSLNSQGKQIALPSGSTLAAQHTWMQRGKTLTNSEKSTPAYPRRNAGQAEVANKPLRLVPGAGLEPARGCPRGIFVPTTAFAATPYLLKTYLWPGLYLYRTMA